MMEEIQIIPRNAIPPLYQVYEAGRQHDLGELRDFRWNDRLRDFMPPPALGVSPSTVGVLLYRAAAKVGAKSRQELLLAYGRMIKR